MKNRNSRQAVRSKLTLCRSAAASAQNETSSLLSDLAREAVGWTGLLGGTGPTALPYRDPAPNQAHAPVHQVTGHYCSHSSAVMPKYSSSSSRPEHHRVFETVDASITVEGVDVFDMLTGQRLNHSEKALITLVTFGEGLIVTSPKVAACPSLYPNHVLITRAAEECTRSSRSSASCWSVDSFSCAANVWYSRRKASTPAAS